MLMTKVNVTRIAGVLLTTLTALNAQSVSPAAPVPRTIRYTGSFHPANGLPVQPVEGITLAVYSDQTGGDPLWQETQNVQVDASGNFAVEMGATLSDGLPLDLLRSGEPRWVGVRVNRPGEAEQPRVQMLSVPYALRASDAEALGGIPASAYLLNPTAVSATTTVATRGLGTVQPVKPRVTSGTANYIGVFTNTSDLGNSVVYQTGGRIGLGNTNPLDFMHVSFTDTSGGLTGYAVQNLGSGAASYSGMLFYDQHGALGQFQGFNNSTHEYRINNIASSGSINFMLGSGSKLLVRSDGDVDIPGSIRKNGILFLHNLGSNSTAVGLNALAANTGNLNTATGYQALRANTTGNNNTATGAEALSSNTGGSGNTAMGEETLVKNITGTDNTAVGYLALYFNTTGTSNTALGVNAGIYTTGSNNIDIGNDGVSNPAENGVIRIGDSSYQTTFYVAGVKGVSKPNKDAVAVVIDSNGQLGTVSSSRRFKEDIQDMGDASSNLLRLRPVTYRYKQPYADGSKPIDYGLIAEEVAEIYPDLVATNKEGQIETVQYQKLTPMLLNEVQKQNQYAQQQDETIRLLQEQNQQQNETNHSLEAQLAALEALLSGQVPTAATAGR